MYLANGCIPPDAHVHEHLLDKRMIDAHVHAHPIILYACSAHVQCVKVLDWAQ